MSISSFHSKITDLLDRPLTRSGHWCFWQIGKICPNSRRIREGVNDIKVTLSEVFQILLFEKEIIYVIGDDCGAVCEKNNSNLGEFEILKKDITIEWLERSLVSGLWQMTASPAQISKKEYNELILKEKISFKMNISRICGMFERFSFPWYISAYPDNEVIFIWTKAEKMVIC